MPPPALPADKLAHRCDAAQFRFATTAELVDLEQIFGQDRAAGAVEFGIGIERPGYNLFVMGPAGSGKHTLVKQYLAERVREAAKSSDWVYVNNFKRPHQPMAIGLPPGRGMALREDMRHLVEELRSTIPASGPERYAALRGQVDATLAARGHAPIGCVCLPDAGIATIAETAKRQRAGAVLLPVADIVRAQHEFEGLVDEIACPVVLIR